MEVYDIQKEKSKKGVKGRVVIGTILLILIIAGLAAVRIYTDLLQLDEIGGYSNVMLKNLSYQVISVGACFLLIFVFLFSSNIFIIKNLKKYFKEIGVESLRLFNFPVAALFAIIGAYLSKDEFYLKAMSFFNSTTFDLKDPLFFNDIGYYVFQRPFLMSLYEYVSGLWLFVIIYTVAYYLIIMTLSAGGNLTMNELKVRYIIRHNLLNIAIFFLIKTFSYQFAKQNLLYDSFLNITGAGYVDVNVIMKYFSVIPYILAVIVVISLFLILRGKLKQSAMVIAVYPVLWIVVMIISQFIQGIFVNPNALVYEKEYLKNNIIQTKSAYGLDKIKNIDFPTVEELTPSILDKNPNTINNIRVVDYKATLDSNEQLQSNYFCYSFNNGDIVNYTVNGKDIPVFITAREMDQSKLTQSGRVDNPYINKTFVYTHGYGIVMNPINKITSEGQIDFILKDLKGTSIDKNLNVKQPRIYYGELTDENVVVNPNDSNLQKEFDYDGTVETSYSGLGGIKLGLFNKLLFAIKDSDVNLFISGNINSNSKLLLNREIMKRAAKAVPFLTLDNDPYILLADDGSLKWIIDAYTTTENYPYSQYINLDNGALNYMRNSVKIVIDAYNGKVEYYKFDERDPIIETYSKIYPGLFKEKSEFPKDLLKHIRYPETMFKVQTEMLNRYHFDVKDPKEGTKNIGRFYGQERWAIAKYDQNVEVGGSDSYQQDVTSIEPYYNMIQLPGGISNKEELVLMRPFTQTGKNNLVSWLAVRNDAENYGEMILFHFPSNTNILGPYQVDASIRSIDSISESMTLWNSSGSTVFKGSLLVLPIENSIMYVLPIYLKSSGSSSIPQVKKVIVGYQKNGEFTPGIGENIKDAISNLFKNYTVKVTEGETPPTTGTTNEGTNTNVGTNKPQTANEKAQIKSKIENLQKQLNELLKLVDDLK